MARRSAGVIVAMLLLVLVPMWAVAMHGEAPAEEIEIDQGVSQIAPLEGFLETPNKLAPSQVGVIVWVALLALVGVLTGAHRFMNRAVRPPENDVMAGDGGETVSPDGGRSIRFPWLETDRRWIVTYHDASEGEEGIIVMGALAALAIVFAALFTGEYLRLARTQFFGVYAAGMFLSLAGLTVAYYAWFMPHIEVVESRGHEP